MKEAARIGRFSQNDYLWLWLLIDLRFGSQIYHNSLAIIMFDGDSGKEIGWEWAANSWIEATINGLITHWWHDSHWFPIYDMKVIEGNMI